MPKHNIKGNWVDIWTHTEHTPAVGLFVQWKNLYQFFRMIENEQPERAIHLYKRAVDICEVGTLASLNIHLKYVISLSVLILHWAV